MTSDFNLKGKVALITGSSCGIGAGIAIEFSRLGASITITGRNEKNLNEVAEKCQALSTTKQKPLVIAGDICDENVRKKLVDETVRHFGRLDILVNNAGYFQANKLIANTSLTDLDAMINIHLRVPYHMAKLTLRHIAKTQGHVINVSSLSSIRPVTQMGAEYGIAKAALDQLTRWIAFEMGKYGVRANSVNPGWIPTDILKRYGLTDEKIQHSREMAESLHALRRVGEVEEVARVVSFLVTGGSFITGVNLLVDGGLSVVPAGYIPRPPSKL